MPGAMRARGSVADTSTDEASAGNSALSRPKSKPNRSWQRTTRPNTTSAKPITLESSRSGLKVKQNSATPAAITPAAAFGVMPASPGSASLRRGRPSRHAVSTIPPMAITMSAAQRAKSNDMRSARGAGSANFAGISATSLPHPSFRELRYPEALGAPRQKAATHWTTAFSHPFERCYSQTPSTPNRHAALPIGAATGA